MTLFQSADHPQRPNHYNMHFRIGKIVQLHDEPEISEVDSVPSSSLVDLYGTSWGESQREDAQKLMEKLFSQWIYDGVSVGDFYDYVMKLTNLPESETIYLVNTYCLV